MGRVTKLMAAVLIVFGLLAVNTPPAHAGNLFESLLNLTDPGWTPPAELMIRNETGRTIAITVHSYLPQYDTWVLNMKNVTINDGRLILTVSDYAHMRIKLKVWNKYSQKWVLKDTLYAPSTGPWYIDAWKVARGEFVLIHSYVRP